MISVEKVMTEVLVLRLYREICDRGVSALSSSKINLPIEVADDSADWFVDDTVKTRDMVG